MGSNISNFNWTTLTLTQYNTSATGQTTWGCLYNVTNSYESDVNVSMYLSNSSSDHNIKCDDDNTIAGSTTLNTSEQIITDLSVDESKSFSCWCDWVNASSVFTFQILFNSTG